MNWCYPHACAHGPTGPFFYGATTSSMTRSSMRVIEYATVEPITLAEARLHLRVDTYGSPEEHPDDNLILAQLSAAREWCEKYLGLAIANQTIEVALDAFDNPINLPFGPVVSVSYLRYLDADGVEQTISTPDYIFDDFSGRLTPADSWPTPKVVTNAVKVRYQVGYSLPGESPTNRQLPFAIRAAILLILGDLYEHRENSSTDKLEQVPMAAQTLLDMYRERRGFA